MTASPQNLPPILGALQPSRQALANSLLSQGTRYLQDGKYDQAIGVFRRASAYAPGETTPYLLMGRTYQFAGNPERAIESFKQALRIDPGSVEARDQLATAYMTSKRYDEAETEFKLLLGSNRNDPKALAALGHIYLTTGRAAEAETQFRAAARAAPQDAASHYSLGLALNAQGRHSDAVEHLERAVGIRSGYAAAHAELARAHFGLGDTDKAETEASLLENMGTGEASLLAQQVRLEMLTPRISYAALSKSTFNPLGDTDTPVAWLDPSLATPGASKVFTMVFQFNQAMDPKSVEDPRNWNISRATGGPGGVYANGVLMNLGRQVGILPIPESVTYDRVTNEVTVSFRITQNAAGNGLIDPSHWVFRFLGTDAAGNPMDPAGDQWNGSAKRSF